MKLVSLRLGHYYILSGSSTLGKDLDRYEALDIIQINIACQEKPALTEILADIVRVYLLPQPRSLDRKKEHPA
jgi:hypothetical protein